MKKMNKELTRYIDNEFGKITDELTARLDAAKGFKEIRQYYSTHIPERVIYFSTEELLDSCLNSLMKEARNKISAAPAEIQNKFYDLKLRDKLREWVQRTTNKLILNPDSVDYSTDPQKRNGLIAAGVTFIAGSALSAKASIALPLSKILISGIGVLIISALAFQIASAKSKPAAKEVIIKDVKNYLDNSKIQILEWLDKVADVFETEFNAYCKEHELEI